MPTDYLILWGGNDIHPSLYKEEEHPNAGPYDKNRDLLEIQLYWKTIREENIPVIGICRGAQLVCVLNGGKLHQHVPSHLGNSHSLYKPNGECIVEYAAADHHQVMIPAGNYEIIAQSFPSIAIDNLGQPYSTAPVPEIVYWPKTKTLAIQPHPEWNQMPRSNKEFHTYCVNLCKELFNIEVEFK